MFETYTRAELVALDEKMLQDWRDEGAAASGNGLRAEVAQANRREIDRQRKLIWEAIAKK